MSLTNSTFYLKLIVLTLSIQVASYQYAEAQFYPAKTYSINDGMPSNSIYDLLQDQQGIMWFLSSKGVFTYNSAEWYLFPDSLGIPNSTYSHMEISQTGEIWVAGQQKKDFVLMSYNGSTWRQIELPDEIKGIKGAFLFDFIEKDSALTFLIGENHTLHVYQAASAQHKILQLPEEVRIYDILAGEQPVISTNRGLYRLQNDSLVYWDAVNSQLPDEQILTSSFYKDELYILGTTWIAKATQNIQVKVIANKLNPLAVHYSHRHNLAVDPNGRIFFSGSSPAKYYDTENNVSHELFVDGRYLNALCNKLYIDRENNVWVGDHRGLFKFNLLRFLNFNKNTQLATDEVSAIYEWDNSYVLANTNHLNFISRDRLLKKVKVSDEPNSRVLDMAVHNDILYIAANSGGLLTYANGQIKEVLGPNSALDRKVTSVELFDDKLLYTTNSGIYDMATNKELAEVKGIRNIIRLSNGQLAIMTHYSGLALMDANYEIKLYSSDNRKLSNVYSAIVWNDQILLATRGGIATLAGDEIVPFNVFESIALVSTYSFTVDFENRLWIGSNEGVFIYDGNELVQYTNRDGLVGNEVNRNALITDSKGRIWIGTELGASVYEYKEDISLELRPTILIEEVITQNGTAIVEGIDLDYDDNTVIFNYQGISFFDESQITYRYKLKSFDDNWTITPSTVREARYTNLPPGAYSFEIQAGIDNHQWSEAKDITLSVSKPYYQENWFRIFALIAIALLLYTIYRIRFYVILKNQENLKRQVEERTREIAEKNKEIEEQNYELKQQSDEIAAINEELEEMVRQRTEKIIEQNKGLMKYAFINSHKLRAPICRLLGLINIMDKVSLEEQLMILNHLKDNTLELDDISREINTLLEGHLPDEAEEDQLG